MRVLHLYADPHLTHGAAIFEYRIAQQLKDDGIFFDYLFSKELLPEDAARYAQNGSRVFELGVDEKLNLIAHEIKANIAYYKFFKSHDYKIVYADTENALRAVHLLMARLAGVPVRVLHSHNTQLQTQSRASHLIARVLRHIFRFSATHYFACSDLAAQWLFPPFICRKKNYKVLQNGVNLSQFRYDEDVRKRIRNDLGIEDNFTLGSIGRFVPQKNQKFLIDVFAELRKIHASAALILIGDGPLRNELMERARQKGVLEHIRFISNVANVSDYLCAMDVFALTSIFEGLGIVNIEAQATGLSCLMSDAVPQEAAVTNLSAFMPLDAGPKVWAERLLEMYAENQNLDRRNTHDQIIRAGYSIDHTTAQLREFYLKNGGSECS